MGYLIREGDDTIRQYYNNAYGDPCFHDFRNYTNRHAVEALIRYVTRTRDYEGRYYELIYWNVFGADPCRGIDVLIQQFKIVQKVCRSSTPKRKMYHFVYRFDDYERSLVETDIGYAIQIASAIGRYFYDAGFQVIYAVHKGENGIHLHFAVNSVNYRTALMFHISKTEYDTYDALTTWISNQAIAQAMNMVCPIRFSTGI